MSVHAIQTDFSTHEWFRLNSIAQKYEPLMRLAYTRAMITKTRLDRSHLHDVITNCLAETCLSTAKIYNLNFNPSSVIYAETVDRLVDKYAGIITSTNASAQAAVKRILPQGLSLAERRDRLNTLGLDIKSAIHIENHRQVGNGDISRVRAIAITNRGNLIAVTETNRVVNAALEALWMDNQQISKADIMYYDNTISDLGNIPKRARKIIVTRRDDRTCDYCDSLDGIKARLGEDFDTEYGIFTAPPFHPHCRCFLIVSTQ